MDKSNTSFQRNQASNYHGLTTGAADYEGKLLITELNIGPDQNQLIAQADELKRPQTDESDRGTVDN